MNPLLREVRRCLPGLLQWALHGLQWRTQRQNGNGEEGSRPGFLEQMTTRPCWVGGPLVAHPTPYPYIPTGALTFMPQALVGVSGAWGSRDGPDFVPVPLGLSTGEDRCPFGLLMAEGCWWGRCVGDNCERGWSARVGWEAGGCEGKD